MAAVAVGAGGDSQKSQRCLVEALPACTGLKARVKASANIGSPPTSSSIEEEVENLALAERWGADTVMDLSTGKRIDSTPEAIIAAASVPIGMVPIYQALERPPDAPALETLRCPKTK